MLTSRVAITSMAAALLVACGGSVTVQDDSSSGGTGGASQAGGAGQSGGTSQGGGGADPGWTHPPGQTFSNVVCTESEMILVVEIWPDAQSTCVASPSLPPSDVLVLGISDWDGSAGTFTAGAPSSSGSGFALLDLDELSGTFTIEPFDDEPDWIQWDLDVGSGRTSLAECGHFDDLGCSP